MILEESKEDEFGVRKIEFLKGKNHGGILFHDDLLDLIKDPDSLDKAASIVQRKYYTIKKHMKLKKGVSDFIKGFRLDDNVPLI